jgi:hypothetical protein
VLNAGSCPRPARPNSAQPVRPEAGLGRFREVERGRATWLRTMALPLFERPNHRPAFFARSDLKCNTAIFVCRIISDGDRRNGERAERHDNRRYAVEPDHAPTERAKPILTSMVRAIMDVDREGFRVMVLAASVIALRLGLVTPVSARRTGLLPVPTRP